MKRISIIVLAAFLLFSAAGCSGDQSAGSGQGAEKSAIFKVMNVSGMPWVMDSDDVGEYDTLDAIDVSDFTIEPGGSYGGGVYIEEQKELGNFIETSPTKYEVTVEFLAGEVPDDPEENNQLYVEDFTIYSLRISGTYNEPVVIEWDGSQFKQVN